MEEDRRCFVPGCPNNTDNYPFKLFPRVPENIKKQWCVHKNIPYNKEDVWHCCDDHFDSKRDLVNPVQVELLRSEPRLRSKAIRAILRFDTKQSANNEVAPRTTSNELLTKSDLCSLPNKNKCDLATGTSRQPTTSNELLTDSDLCSPPKKNKCDLATATSRLPVKVDAATQVNLVMVDKSTNYRAGNMMPSIPVKQNSTSAGEMQTCQESYGAPSLSSEGFIPSMTSYVSDITVLDTQNESSSPADVKNLSMLSLVLSKPETYLGVPSQFVRIIDYISEKSEQNVKSLCLVLALFKIKTDDSLERMSDQFQLTLRTVGLYVFKGITVLSSFLKNFIYLPSQLQIKRNLPLDFQLKCSDVTMIIAYFEVQIVRPSNPQCLAQTQSQYKNRHTLKYLVGCTPNGFISFVSNGYACRISDKAIVINSNVLNILPENAVIFADRGFKELESVLSEKKLKLLKPPSVYQGTQETKSEAIQCHKVIGSLRITMERVIKRIRGFAMLKAHSVVNCRFVPFLDQIVIVACGLINSQSEIIKQN